GSPELAAAWQACSSSHDLNMLPRLPLLLPFRFHCPRDRQPDFRGIRRTISHKAPFRLNRTSAALRAESLFSHVHKEGRKKEGRSPRRDPHPQKKNRQRPTPPPPPHEQHHPRKET